MGYPAQQYTDEEIARMNSHLSPEEIAEYEEIIRESEEDRKAGRYKTGEEFFAWMDQEVARIMAMTPEEIAREILEEERMDRRNGIGA